MTDITKDPPEGVTGTPEPSSNTDWSRHQAIVVQCPECCFAFDAVHVDADESGVSGYSCPSCAHDIMANQSESDGIPVGGTYMECSLAELKQRCWVLIEEEQRKASPDTHLIAVLCDAIRLGRETAALASFSMDHTAEEIRKRMKDL